MVSGSLALQFCLINLFVYFVFFLVLSVFFSFVQGSGLSRGQSPVEWREIPSVLSFFVIYFLEEDT